LTIKIVKAVLRLAPASAGNPIGGARKVRRPLSPFLSRGDSCVARDLGGRLIMSMDQKDGPAPQGACVGWLFAPLTAL